MTEIQELSQNHSTKGAPAAPVLSGGAKTQLSPSPRPEDGNTLSEERSKSTRSPRGDSASKELQKTEKSGLHNTISIQSHNPLSSAKFR